MEGKEEKGVVCERRQGRVGKRRGGKRDADTVTLPWNYARLLPAVAFQQGRHSLSLLMHGASGQVSVVDAHGSSVHARADPCVQRVALVNLFGCLLEHPNHPIANH